MCIKCIFSLRVTCSFLLLQKVVKKYQTGTIYKYTKDPSLLVDLGVLG